MIEEAQRLLALTSARASSLLFLLSLLGLCVAAMLAARLALSEPLIILAGLGGFVLAGFAVRWFSRGMADDPALQPLVLRAMLARPVGREGVHFARFDRGVVCRCLA